MLTEAFSAEVQQVLDAYLQSANTNQTLSVPVDGTPTPVPYPFPSPADWRDCWIYFLMLDRFNNPQVAPNQPWNCKYGFRQGGTFNGVREQLPYLQTLGVKALWLSPVVKNTRPEIDGFAYAYPGYNAQDFLNLEARFASDGTLPTAEREFTALVNEAHARGMYVILDIVLNHAGRVFDYVRNGQVVRSFQDKDLLYSGPGGELPIQWMTGLGWSRGDWQGEMPARAGTDDAVWPLELQRPIFFRRKGSTVTDTPAPPLNFVPGDFDYLRQMVIEYDATQPGQEWLRDHYGVTPVLSVLVRAYQYLIAKYDVDGFRIDTVKYIRPDMIASFGNAIREFAQSAGKRNFFTFGEIWDSDNVIDNFIGRDTGANEGFGIDSALDFPLFFTLPPVIKALGPNPPGVETLANLFGQRKSAEAGQISSHGEAGKYFVSFIDNHDQNSRFNAPGVPPEQVTMALALLFALQGIPCVYYGTEQGLQGCIDGLDAKESVREALWGKTPNAFDQTADLYRELQRIAALRMKEPALRYGRLYFREASGDGNGFGLPRGPQGLIAFSRVLSGREVLAVANTNGAGEWDGFVLLDVDINRKLPSYSAAYSNATGSLTAARPVQIAEKTLYPTNQPSYSAQIAFLPVQLKPWEVQILTV